MLIYRIYLRGIQALQGGVFFLLQEKNKFSLPGVRYDRYKCIFYLDIGGGGVFP